MAHRVQLGRDPWEYDAPMYHDFEQSSPAYGECSVDKWFDTSATKGLRSPVSGTDKENDDTIQEATSKSGKPASTKRRVLGNVTNAINVIDPVVNTKRHVPVEERKRTTHKTSNLKAAQTPGQGKAQTSFSVQQEMRCLEIKKSTTESTQKIESDALQSTQARKPVTRSQRKASSLTVPKSPMLRSRLRSGMHKKVVKSSEELEMEEIERKRIEIQARKQKRKNVEQNAGASLDSSSKRLKAGKALKHDTSLQNPVGSFTVGKSISKNRTMSTSRGKSWRPKLTRPKSPNFATTRRARPPRYKSTEDLELEKIAKVKFKAKPVKENVLKSRQAFGSGSKQQKNITVPEPFSFATDKRTKQPHDSEIDRPTLKPFVFGEGPITRSKAKQVVTTGAKKREPYATLAQSITSVQEANPKSETLPDFRPKIRPATRGSLLKGGAMRIVRENKEVPESPITHQAFNEPQETCDVVTEDCNETITFDNPLYKP